MLPEEITILTVDDDPEFIEILQQILEMEGYKILTATNGLEAIESFDRHKPSLVLLDIKLPDIDGHIVCQHIRKFSSIPVIMITCKDSEADKVAGLDAGADDYITKPILSKELAARIRAALRRSIMPLNTGLSNLFNSRHLVIDFNRKAVTLDNTPVDLTAIEYRILEFFARNPDRVLSPEQILTQVWNDDGTNYDSHLVHVNIGRLRKKLDDVKGLNYILTKPGQGYIMNIDSQS